MTILLVNALFCLVNPTPVTQTNVVYQDNIVTLADEEAPKEEERVDNTLENALLGSGVGLVAVGGVGAGIIAHNNNKPKDVPVKTIERTRNKEDKDSSEITK